MSIAYYNIITGKRSHLGDFIIVSFASFVPMVIGIAMWICGKDKYDSDGMIGYVMMWMQRILCLVALVIDSELISVLIGIMIYGDPFP